MSYIVEQQVKGNTYLYLVKNARSDHGWVKAKKYLGKSVPDLSMLNEYELKLEEQLKQRIAGLKPPKTKKLDSIKLLKNEEISIMENIRKSHEHPPSADSDIDFLIKFTFHSNAIEGSTNSLKDTKTLLKEETVPAGKKLRDIYEAVNTEDAYRFMKCYERDITKKFILRLHEILMHRLIHDAGSFRKNPVKITGSEWLPPQPEDIDAEIERFMTFYRFIKSRLHPIEVASLVHIKFVQLHPFTDGNGRTARLLMNFVLMKNNYPPVVITRTNQQKYYALLEATHEGRQYAPFVKFIYKCVMAEYS